MLSDDERRRIIDLLAGAIVQSPRQIVLSCLVQGLRPSLVNDGDAYVLLRCGLELCEGDGYAMTPSALSRFLRDAAIYAVNHGDEVLALAERFARRPVTAGDPFLDRIIREDMVFLDRGSLRTAVQRLLTPNTPRPVLVVEGPRYSGKSRTGFFIEHLGACQDGLKFCRLKLEPDDDQPTVLHVARDLLVKLGGTAETLPPADLTNERRWPRDLANVVWSQLLQVGGAAHRGWVIILDGFGPGKADAAIHAFVLQLAENMTSVGGRAYRLLLIDYDSTALVRIAEQFNTIRLGDISDAEARDELQQIFTDIGRQDAGALADAVLAGLPVPLSDLREVGSRCSSMLQSLKA